MNSLVSDWVEYDHGIYRREGRYLVFKSYDHKLILPDLFAYNMSDYNIRCVNGLPQGEVAVIGWESEVKVFNTKEEVMESKFKVEQKVYCIRRGAGKVTCISSDMDDPYVQVDFVGSRYSYYPDGKYSSHDTNPTLLTLEDARAKGYDVPKQKIVKEKTVYINLYNHGKHYAHDTEQEAKYGAQRCDGTISGTVILVAHPVTIKYEVEE